MALRRKDVMSVYVKQIDDDLRLFIRKNKFDLFKHLLSKSSNRHIETYLNIAIHHGYLCQ